MKNYFLFIFMQLSFFCFSQEQRLTDGAFYLNNLSSEKQFIEGSFLGFDKSDTLLLFPQAIPDSYYQKSDLEIRIQDGKFQIENTFDYPQLYYSMLASDKGKIVLRHKIFFLDGSTKSIRINYADWEQSIVDGKTAEEYETSFKPKALKSLDLSDEEAFTSLLYQNFNKVDSFLYDYTKENPQSFIPLWLLAQRFHLLGYSELGKNTLYLFNERIKKSPIWIKLSDDFKNAPIKEAARFPKFEVENLNGEKTMLSLSKAKKKPCFTVVC